MNPRAKSVLPYSGEAKTYSLSNYPGVKIHFKCNETSGTDMVDEVNGCIIRPYQSTTINGTISFGNPVYTVDPECIATPVSPIIGTYPTLDGSKFILNLGIGYCTDATAGRVDVGVVGGNVPTSPAITTSFIGGMHTIIYDNTLKLLTPSDASPPNLTAGVSYAIATMIRPGSGLCGGYLYDTSGSLIHSQEIANNGLGLISPNGYARPRGLAFYQWIVYQFTTEPTDLLTGIKWHIGSAMSGIKAPYPAWKYRT